MIKNQYQILINNLEIYIQKIEFNRDVLKATSSKDGIPNAGCNLPRGRDRLQLDELLLARSELKGYLGLSGHTLDFQTRKLEFYLLV